jgi:apolipoprotein N-acyltransferase
MKVSVFTGLLTILAQAAIDWIALILKGMSLVSLSRLRAPSSRAQHRQLILVLAC